jgi:hypothetical protein
MSTTTPNVQASAFSSAALAAFRDQTRAEGVRAKTKALAPAVEAHIRDSLERAYNASGQMAEGTMPVAARKSAAPGDVIYAEALWWGWRLVIPHDQVEPFLKTTGDVSSIISAGLGVIPEVGSILSSVVKLYVGIMSGVIRAVDRGKGVDLNQTWLIEAAIIASGGLLIGPALAAAFIPTTRH